MTKKRKNKISSQEIAEYLILNPDFFNENPQVLSSLEVVHETGSAVSLIQKQVELLRSNYNSTTDKLMGLLTTAKNNEDIFFLTKKLILNLIDASNIEELTNHIELSFEEDFGATKSKLIYFSEPSKELPKGRLRKLSEATELLSNILKSKKIFCGEIDKDLTNFIFNQKVLFKEVALIPLRSNSIRGMISLGTDQVGKYSENKDTLFLDFIAEIASKLIDNYNS
mgnify:CR=1 FL=1|tara:strand:+ start:2594 stop:3268 length:675 start_codon:yes stop_codon:yes gene_type:complete